MKIKEVITYIKNSENLLSRLMPLIAIIIGYYLLNMLITAEGHGLSPIYRIALIPFKWLLLMLALGYQVITQRNYMLCRPDFLPNFAEEILSLLKSGFKYYAALLLYMIPFVFYLGVWFSIARPFSSDHSNMYSPISIVILVIEIILFLTFLYFYPALLILFSTKFKFLEMFNFKQAYGIISTVPKAYLKALIINISLALPVYVLDYVFRAYPIAIAILNGFSTSILTLIWSVYFGDVFRKYVEIHRNPEENILA